LFFYEFFQKTLSFSYVGLKGEGTYTYTLDDEYIQHGGYLVKSPPLDKMLNKVTRWHLRYFVLYDNKKLHDKEPQLHSHQVALYYFENWSAFHNRQQQKGNTQAGFPLTILRACVHAPRLLIGQISIIV